MDSHKKRTGIFFWLAAQMGIIIFQNRKGEKDWYLLANAFPGSAFKK
jgi:hypothetical protein